MRIDIFLLSFLSMSLLACNSSKQTGSDIVTFPKLTVKVRIINPYCGGAAPSEEMERERMKGSPYAKRDLYIKMPGYSEAKKFRTNENGELMLEARSGEFCFQHPYVYEDSLITAWKKQGWEFDDECLKKEISRCEVSFELPFTENDTSMNITLRGRCQYRGPNRCVINEGPPPP